MERAQELSENGGMVRFRNSWYSTRNLSKKTLEWLSWYNRLPDKEQDAVSFVPHDLYHHCYEYVTAMDAT